MVLIVHGLFLVFVQIILCENPIFPLNCVCLESLFSQGVLDQKKLKATQKEKYKREETFGIVHCIFGFRFLSSPGCRGHGQPHASNQQQQQHCARLHISTTTITTTAIARFKPTTTSQQTLCA